MKRNRKAKILATLGPASCTIEIIEKLFVAGCDVFRMNFSHGTIEDHRNNYDIIRKLEKKYNHATCILADLQGPKLRVGNFKNDKVKLNLLPLICYEIIYSGKLSNKKDFDYIINISEDGWFGKSIGPKQHFLHSIFRSIESGKYIIRSANNGNSAVINPMGFVEQEVGFGKTGYVNFSESKSIKPTLFLLYGNKIFLILILLYIFLIFSFNRLNK